MRKNTTIDSFRILLILLVITQHSNGLIDKANLGTFDGLFYQVWNTLVYFCIPFFYAITGYFAYNTSKSDGANRKRVSRILHLIKILMFSELLYIAISSCFVGLPSTLKGFINKNNLLTLLSDANPIPTIFDSMLLYFLIVLIFVSVIELAFTMIFKNLRDKMMLLVALISFFVAQLHGGVLANLHIFSIITQYFGGGSNRILGGLIYFTVGYAAKKYFSKLTALKTPFLLAILLILCVLFTFELQITPYGITLPFIVFFTIILFARLPNLFKQTCIIIPKIGSKWTLYIYLFHPIILWLLDTFLLLPGQKLSLILWLGWIFLTYLLTLLLSVAFIRVRDLGAKHINILAAKHFRHR